VHVKWSPMIADLGNAGCPRHVLHEDDTVAIEQWNSTNSARTPVINKQMQPLTQTSTSNQVGGYWYASSSLVVAGCCAHMDLVFEPRKASAEPQLYGIVPRMRLPCSVKTSSGILAHCASNVPAYTTMLGEIISQPSSHMCQCRCGC
jgi:hypothetical protein